MLIEHNPLLKKPVLALLNTMTESQYDDRVDLEQACANIWDGSWRISPSETVNMCLREGLISQNVYVNGEPYAGELTDIQLDESIPLDAEVITKLNLNEAATQVIETYSAASLIEALFLDKPYFTNTFKSIIELCNAEGGASRSAIEEVATSSEEVRDHKAKTHTTVYPQFFIDSLESAGAIEWGGAWCTTEAGNDWLKAS
jgi:hypothetical protein